MFKAVVINLFGAPGTGKSTIAANLFSRLKMLDINCELVTEYAKDLTWSQRHDELSCQPAVFGKQLKRLWTIRNSVDFIVTDSPLLLSVVYAKKYWNYDGFINSVYESFDLFSNKMYLLTRIKKYNPAGRNQTEKESDEIRFDIERVLEEKNYMYHILPGRLDSVDFILKDLGVYNNEE